MVNLVICLFAAAPHVSVARDAVLVDARVIGTVKLEPRLLLIPELAAALDVAPDQVVDAEADVPFSMLMRVLFTMTSRRNVALWLRVGGAGPVQVTNPNPPAKRVFISVPSGVPERGSEEALVVAKLGAPPKGEPVLVSFSVADEVSAGRLFRLLIAARDAGFSNVALGPSALAPSAPAAATMNPEFIRQVIHANRGMTKACLEKSPGVTGKVLLKWKIVASGDSTAIEVMEDSTKAFALAECLVGIVRRLKFPPPKGAMAEVSYPFVF